MRFIKEEYHLRLFHISDLRQDLKEFRKKIKKEGRIHRRVKDQLSRVKDIDLPSSV